MEFESVYQVFRSLWVVWLMAIFIGIFAWAFWPRNKDRFEAYGRIPFDNDEYDAGNHGGGAQGSRSDKKGGR